MPNDADTVMRFQHRATLTLVVRFTIPRNQVEPDLARRCPPL